VNETIGPADGRRVRTQGLDVVVPGAWWRIPLRDAADRERSVKALVKRQLADTTASATLRHETEQSLLAAAADAASKQGVLWWISRDHAAGVPLSMSLLLSEIDQFRVRSFDHATEQLLGREGAATSRMRPGRVLRHVYHRNAGEAVDRIGGAARADAMPVVSETLQVDYWLERPDSRLVLLAFASPLVRYESALLELFDTVVDSIRWQDDEAPTRRLEPS
jgi:hypothetical protein